MVKKPKKKIEEKLKDIGIKDDELSEENKKEWQKLKNGEIKGPEELVATETKIKENIYQKEAEKKVANLTSQANEALKLNKKDQIVAVKKLLLEFISSSNIYYSAHRKTVENLLIQLENYSVVNNNQNNSLVKPKNSPWKLIIPLLLIVLLVVALLIAKRVIKKRKRKA